jgi:type 2 lantibiotic biosynthesis protein LanM
VPTRVVVRSTRSYGLLLSESLHPSLLQDGLRRDLFFDALWQQVPQQPFLESLIPHECDDLQRLDIPLFTTRPECQDIFTSAGDRVQDFFVQSGWQAAQERLAALDADDAERQVWLMRAAFAGRLSAAGRRRASPRVHSGPVRPEAAVDPCRAVGAAVRIGQRIATLAIHAKHEVTWLRLTNRSDGRWITAPLGMDLYDGISGVALFLAFLGDISGRTEITALADKAAATLLRQLETQKVSHTAIGLFNGWGGPLFTLAHLGMLWRRDDLLQTAAEIVDHAAPLVAEDRSLDVVGGAAGCILALAAAAPALRMQGVDDLARLCGAHLAREAISMDGGAAWPSGVGGQKPLTGFSHGAAGMALALCRSTGFADDERRLSLARSAIDYERSLFSERERNWPDLRTETSGAALAPGEAPSAPAFWCHGAAGIGLARIGMLEHFADEQARRELEADIEIACATTLREGFSSNHSLCHGSVGNLELLWLARRRLGMGLDNTEIDARTDDVLAEIDDGRWCCGHPKEIESIGLMTGLAGIGYGLLRLAYPQRVPSVLLPTTGGRLD